MPWWGFAYLILFLALCCGGIYLDITQPEPIWYTVADGLSALCSITAILAFWHPLVAGALGGFLFGTTLFALIWDCFSLEHDLTSEFPDPELTDDENRVGSVLATAISFAFCLPAYYFGFVTAYDQVRAATPAV
jgi:hypothetical protein